MMNGPQPLFGARQKRQGRHQDQRHGEVETAEPRANQPHVVIQGQPAHDGIVPAGFDRLANGSQIRKQISMTEHYAFGVPCAARCVLKQRHVAGARQNRWCQVGTLQVIDGPNELERRHQSPQ